MSMLYRCSSMANFLQLGISTCTAKVVVGILTNQKNAIFFFKNKYNKQA
jgi:hypothetical protein